VIPRLRIGQKLTLALAALLLTTMAVAAVGLVSLGKVDARTTALYEDNIITSQATTALEASLHRAETAALRLAVSEDTAERAELGAELRDQLVPAVDAGIRTLRELHAGEEDELPEVEHLAAGWAAFKRLLGGGLASRDRAGREAAGRAVDAAVGPLTDKAAEMAAFEGSDARESQAAAAATYRSARADIIELSAGSVAVWLLIALALIRNIVPRVRTYARFAAGVAGGELGGELAAGGGDELAELGRALNDMVRRQLEQRAHEREQAEFVDTLQLSETEAEAHGLLKRHLERSITGGTATVLNRNNSADRLEAVTDVAPDCPLAESLQGARPRSCLAVRFGRAHLGGPDHEPLLACQVCSGLAGSVTCEPLLVGGEVIGSILVDQPGLAGDDSGRIKESVTQAAPVQANLRNLAIAETRAATDALTGLPNNRAVRDTIKRMVAQASRSVSPLSAALLDLDHFKKINDLYGHSRGDEVLAAVAAVLRASVRASDFVGRYGGEEFVLLLPDTDAQQAGIVAEKVRAAVARLAPTDIEQHVTASLGVASLPKDASDADSLIRAADRALYTAKGAGRNRVELFRAPERPAPERERPSSERERPAPERSQA
jgi:diguanylate cyclase (GGDEF)-like protein